MQATVKHAAKQAVPSMGLCESCLHMESCNLSVSSAGPVHFCEEFACEEGSCLGDEAPGTGLEAKPVPGAPVREEPAGLKGLCVNCENRFDCSFPKSPGGVWHCAEYS